MTTDTQPQLMAFDPATGEPRPYPSHAGQWRDYHGTVAWLFNPWTGTRRLAADVGTDPLGRLVSGGHVFLNSEFLESMQSEAMHSSAPILHGWSLWPDGQFKSEQITPCDPTYCPKARLDSSSGNAAGAYPNPLK